MKHTSRYTVPTTFGTLQLSKGTYLTLMRRKQQGRKKYQIIHKKTVKQLTIVQQKSHSETDVEADGWEGRVGQQRGCCVGSDQEIYSCGWLPGVDLKVDNDCESQWCDIKSGVSSLCWQLSLATFSSFCQ